MALNDNARRWVEALRSGEYRQGKGRLRNEGDEFCCLGVACDLYSKEFGDLKVVKRGDYYTYDGSPSALPDSVGQWLGLSTCLGNYITRHGWESWLADDNDAGRSFQEIAYIIESEPKGLFSCH